MGIENEKEEKSFLSKLKTFFFLLFICDRGGIQTPNPQSRNLMRYSVAPRGRVQCSKIFNFQSY
tara:strand:- start:540 stop:731 length:192 start_codon:yes stop_codon:yes gene_type:complete